MFVGLGLGKLGLHREIPTRKKDLDVDSSINNPGLCYIIYVPECLNAIFL
jgi:hypothetical protein